MMQLFRLALAAATIWGVSAIPFINAVKIGDKLPSVELHSGFPPKKVDLKEYIAKKSVIIVGLPGAFTPT